MRLAQRRLVDQDLPNITASITDARSPVLYATDDTTELQTYLKMVPSVTWQRRHQGHSLYGTRLLWFQERSYQKAPPSANAEGNYVAIRDTKPNPQCTPNQQIMGRHSLTAVRTARLSVHKFSRNSQYIFVNIPVPNLIRMDHTLRTQAEFHLRHYERAWLSISRF